MHKLLISCLTLALTAPLAHAGPTLDAIRSAGSLACGVDFEEAEYSLEDAHGNHSLFDLDLCKAVAVAVLGPGAKFTVVPYRVEREALNGLKDGKIAMLATASTNLLNSANPAFRFSRPIFFDYQAFLVNTSLGIKTPQDLAGKKTCFLVDTEIENQLAAYMDREKIKWLPFPFSEEGEMEAALITGNCAAISADVSQLGYERIAFKGMARTFEILPAVIAHDPEAIASRSDDPQWAAILNWVAEALIRAEELGITRANLADQFKSDDPEVMRLLGTQKGYAQSLGLTDPWVANVITAVGNYGELFDRTLGRASLMNLNRGPNNLSTQGGLMYTAPIR